MNDKHKESSGEQGSSAAPSENAGETPAKKPWHTPKVMSQEPLEVVAAACAEVGLNGKAGPPICGVLGS